MKKTFISIIVCVFTLSILLYLASSWLIGNLAKNIINQQIATLNTYPFLPIKIENLNHQNALFTSQRNDKLIIDLTLAQNYFPNNQNWQFLLQNIKQQLTQSNLNNERLSIDLISIFQHGPFPPYRSLLEPKTFSPTIINIQTSFSDPNNILKSAFQIQNKQPANYSLHLGLTNNLSQTFNIPTTSLKINKIEIEHLQARISQEINNAIAKLSLSFETQKIRNQKIDWGQSQFHTEITLNNEIIQKFASLASSDLSNYDRSLFSNFLEKIAALIAKATIKGEFLWDLTEQKEPRKPAKINAKIDLITKKQPLILKQLQSTAIFKINALEIKKMLLSSIEEANFHIKIDYLFLQQLRNKPQSQQNNNSKKKNLNLIPIINRAFQDSNLPIIDQNEQFLIHIQLKNNRYFINDRPYNLDEFIKALQILYAILQNSQSNFGDL